MSDTRWLTKRPGSNNWHAVKGVPRALKSAVGKSHFLKSLETPDLVVARSRRFAALAEFNAVLDQARRQTGAADVLGAAMDWRTHLRRIEQGDTSGVWYSHVKGPELQAFALSHGEMLVEEDANEVARQHGPAVAAAYRGIALGTATPLLHYVDAWLREGGARGPLNARTQNQYRSIVHRFAQWCERGHMPPTIEGVTKEIVGAYITEAVAEGMDPITHNSHISALCSYWRWMCKRTSVQVNPWLGQSRSKAGINRTGERKRPFTDAEVSALLQGGADQELDDAIRIAALSGLCIEEMYKLTVHDCRDGIFDVRKGKREARVRKFPIHSDLAGIIARRTKGKAASDYLFPEAGPPRPGRERSMKVSKRFGRYRIGLGVEDREEGRRHSRIDFHSLRRWFITVARRRIDWAVVAVVAGHKTGRITDDIYNGGPEFEERQRCVESVRLP